MKKLVVIVGSLLAGLMSALALALASSEVTTVGRSEDAGGADARRKTAQTGAALRAHLRSAAARDPRIAIP
ncbi:protein of unknown function precursor, FAD/NAD(P)-binding domain [Methylorubrum extorquens DM4]|uniref:Uncharacterized protein n=1 Tax=Methylorubrum extorquens (strain DSM 6343 / CIP 106787 / DM4) TaxID=661410 RepID=C7C972_METED|nr:hypothetical protein [Methylorubrum extorquens]CAX22038.1 protein of unknown function precursor, FAD/NAD(P)-binding domain [Methylorubrum extorquens DM4]